MSFELPLTNYQMKQVSFYVKAFAIIFFTVFFIGNISVAIFGRSTSVNEESYTMKDGYPIFQSQKEYIRFVRTYPYDVGIKFTIHKIQNGQSFWDLTRRYNISLDTIIGANPFLKELVPGENMELVIPSKDGVLFPFNNFYDVVRMKELLKHDGPVNGSYLPGFFSIISTDDIRLVFFPGKKPAMVNDSIERIYNYRLAFQRPLRGYLTSLFGDRVDPMLHGTRFHNGIDIMGRTGTAIKPIRDGLVTYTGWRSGYGKTIMVQHRDGYTSLYGHCSRIHVKVGTWVKKKDVIGRVGSTGRSTGPHLHFTFMKHGEPVNPIFFIW